MNATPLPRRSGISSTPYVFSGRGRVQLLPSSPAPLPRPLFSVPAHKLPRLTNSQRSRRRKASPPAPEPSPEKADESEDSDEESGDYGDASSSCGLFRDDFEDPEEETNDPEEEDDEEDAPEEDLNAALTTTKYNARNAFAAYLRSVHQRSWLWKFPQSDSSDSDDDDGIPGSTPGLAHFPPSSSPVSSSAFPSSPASTASSSCEPYQASVLSSLSKSAPTPAPPHAPWQRRRLERVQKRMDTLKKKRWMCTEDDSDDAKVDELEDKGSKKEEKAQDAPVLESSETGNTWDPFDDEIEV